MGDVTNDEIYQMLKSVLEKTDNIEKELTTNKNELTNEIRNIKSEIKLELDELRKNNVDIKQENQKLKTRLVAIERRVKKYNLVFYGVEDNKNRIEELEKILITINGKLGLHCKHADIRDSHRIGQETRGRVRPIVVEFANYQLKSEILANSKKLKGSGIYVQNDYTQEDYQERKILLENLKIARENDLQAVIKNNILVVEGERYTCEDLKSQSERFVKKNDNTKGTEIEKNPISEDIEIKAQKDKSDEVYDTDENPQKQVTIKNRKENGDKINFRELIEGVSKAKKRKEQPTDSSNQVKRSARINKLPEDK